MSMEFVSTSGAPKAIGPYSQATVFGDLVFTAGQIALDPASMEIVDGGIAEQTERVLSNLEAVLTAAGSGFSGVLKTTVFLRDMADFAAMNEVYARRLGGHRPARSTVAAAGLPRSVLVEIECVAVRAPGRG
ncbi:MAG: RidA family protein [Gemmatimonadales bacterium]